MRNWVLPKSLRSPNSKTWKHIHEMFSTQSETSLPINCRKFLVCQLKNGGAIGMKAAP